MAILELVLTGSINGVETKNVFNYVSAGSASTLFPSFVLARAFGALPSTVGGVADWDETAPLWRIAGIQHPEFKWTQILVYNPYDPVDFYASPITPTLAGRNSFATGEATSAFFCYRFTSTRARRDIRAGNKFFAGVAEGSMGQFGVLGGDFLNVAMADAAAAMSQVLAFNDEGANLTFSPAIVKKQEYPVLNAQGEPNGRTAYRYIPNDEEAQLADTVVGVSWLAQDTVTTMNSRKPGRGI